MSNPEYLSDDILDEEFLKIFENIRRFQLFLGCCRVDARDRFVTEPTINQKVYTIAIIIFVIYGYYDIAQYNSTIDIQLLDRLFFTSFLINNVLIYAMGVIHVRFLNNKKNADLYIKLCKLSRLFKPNYKMTVQKLIYSNDKRVLTLYSLGIGMLFIVIVIGQRFVLSSLAILIVQSSMHMEIFHCSNIMVFFGFHMRLVYYMITHHLNRYEIYVDIKDVPLMSEVRMREVLGPVGDTDFVDFPLEVFGETNGTIIVVSTALLDLMGIFFFCFHAEVFQREVTRVKQSSINIMSVYPNGPLRKKAQKIFKLIENSPPRFSVYGMWQISAHTFIQLCTLMTWLLVTLLQFTFL
ncbi:uncharacterized protein LOC128676524 [Plodia interpunctella]|uniref:uncharacterized protein LOC128676524 n=1 Tax=Plodia interpunctella TaxID=58824 RepID=UPI003100C8B7